MMTWADVAADYCGEVWPDTVKPLEVLEYMHTQWKTGMSGRTGLDYTALPVVFEMLGIDKPSQPAMFRDLREMEMAALEEMYKGT